MAQLKPKAQNVQHLQRYGPYGSQAAPNFDFIIDRSARIKSVKVGDGWVVDGIGFDIVDKDGNCTQTEYFGGKGREIHTILLADDESIIKISGFEGDYLYGGNKRHIAQIKIHTSWNPEGYGPYGMMKNCTNTKPFSTPCTTVGPLTGFFGVTGDYLEGIGVYAKKN